MHNLQIMISETILFEEITLFHFQKHILTQKNYVFTVFAVCRQPLPENCTVTNKKNPFRRNTLSACFIYSTPSICIGYIKHREHPFWGDYCLQFCQRNKSGP